MCTGRVDLSFILHAFSRGADGVLLGGCWPGECHYVTEGNYDALGNVHLCKRLLEHAGIDPARLRLEWMAASEGARFAEVVNDFVRQVKGLGPLCAGEGVDRAVVRRKLEAAQRLVPYFKLVERERLRVPTRSEQGYDEFFARDETRRLFKELIVDKLTLGEILLALREGPLTTGEIARAVDLTPSEVSKHLSLSSRKGLIRYDAGRGCYALVGALAEGR